MNKMEWIILDDGSDSVEDLFVEASKTIPNLRYYYDPNKSLIGAKRNKLNELSMGDIIIAMDDDDYYPPSRISTVVAAFLKNPSIDLAGSSEMLMYYSDTGQIARLGPFFQTHTSNGTLAYRRRYMLTHKYNAYITHAEEVEFLDNYKNSIIQLDPMKSILVICHNNNTYDKRIARDGDEKGRVNPKFKETSLKLRDIVKEKDIREFYISMRHLAA